MATEANRRASTRVGPHAAPALLLACGTLTRLTRLTRATRGGAVGAMRGAVRMVRIGE
jgi:hypothetical protein